MVRLCIVSSWIFLDIHDVIAAPDGSYFARVVSKHVRSVHEALL